LSLKNFACLVYWAILVQIILMTTLTKITFIVLLLSGLGYKSSKAQADTTKRAQNVFVELLGAGITISANYDTRFSNKRDGLGGRVGAGYLSTSNGNLLTIPVQLNYLLGKKGKYFEVGLGATFGSMNNRSRSFRTVTDNSNGETITYLLPDDDSDVLGVNYNRSSGFIGTMTLGYRYQPLTSGFSFRGYINPVLDRHEFIPYFFGLSFGYTFQ
jgi:hypothetical protein